MSSFAHLIRCPSRLVSTRWPATPSPWPIAWSDVHLNGKLTLPGGAAQWVRFEIEKLNAIRAAMGELEGLCQ